LKKKNRNLNRFRLKRDWISTH